MCPILFEIGKIKIAGYGTMIAIGFILALIMAEKRAEKKGLNKDLIFSLGITCIVSGFVGAKLMHYIVEFKYYMANPSRFLDINSGFVVYGGIILGIISGLVFCKIKKLEFGRYFDIVMPSVALAQAFGRIGCFMAGCCYGKETTSAIGVTFKPESFAPHDVKLIPVQLFSSIALFVLVIILVYFAKNEHRRPYKVAGLYMILYSIGRFVIEFFRSDDRGTVGMFSTSQFISLGIVVIGFVVYNMSSIIESVKKENVTIDDEIDVEAILAKNADAEESTAEAEAETEESTEDEVKNEESNDSDENVE